MNTITFNEEKLKQLTEDEVLYLYNNQNNENLNIPPIDRIKEEGDWIYKIFCYGNNYNKYLCRVFEDPNDPFNNY